MTKLYKYKELRTEEARNNAIFTYIKKDLEERDLAGFVDREENYDLYDDLRTRIRNDEVEMVVSWIRETDREPLFELSGMYSLFTITGEYKAFVYSTRENPVNIELV